MRNILRYIVCACLALALGGCIKDEIVGNNFCREGLLSLNIGINETRAAGDNDNGDADLTLDQLPLNENRIDDYEVFLFASGATGEAKFSTYVSGVNATDSTTNNAISVPAGALAELFGSGDTCNIYVVANLGKSLASELNNASTPLTLANLKDYIVSADFTTPVEYEDQDLNLRNSAPIQPNFVMDSSGTDTVTKSGNNLSGEVYITRAASKISFMAYIGESMTIDGKVWIPDLENIKVAFNNVVEKGAIDNGSDTEDTFTMPQVEGLYKNLSGVQLLTDANVHTQTPEFEGEVQGVSSWQKVDILVPFYTYSSIWNATENKVNPSIVLTVPWFVKDNKSTTLTNYNYTIPLTAANGDLKLVRNKHYRIALRVGVLGDLDQLASSEFSYEVLDWVGNDINVDLSDPKYLVVEKDYVEMNNVTSFSVPYSSSDAVSAKIITVSRDNVKNCIVKEDIRDIAESTNTEDGWNDFNNQDFSISTEGGVVTLTHKLDNDRNSDYFDYVPYEIIVEVVNESGFVERITFVQYPAMYVEADANTDYQQNTDHNETWVNSWNDNHGYQWVNGYRGSSYSSAGSGNNAYHYVTVNSTRVQFLASSNGLSSNAGNKNPNMYTITVSSFSDGSFLVGDPRTTHYDETLKDAKLGNSDYYVFASAPALSGTSPRRLQYYYPTDASDNTINVISPKFRVASSYSVLGSEYLTSREVARRRCASYQEDGYPAGRWRMATAAEMQFMIQLSQQELIPALFSTNTNYWCAHGVINYVTGATTATLNKVTSHNSGGSIRCVYDEWYWGSDKAIESNADAKFTWGDELRPGDSAN
ncbi:MAG: hypothetical protein IIW45_00320 [Alistipes sp.]|nr:hypothetical protein [Alistipes sp.]